MNIVEAVIMKSVEKAGLRPVRRVCHAIHPHAATTANTESAVIHQCI